MTEREHNEDHEELADELDKRADQLEKRSEELEGEIEDARGDWKAKQRSDGVAGGPPPRDDD